MRHGALVDRACRWWLTLTAVAVSLVWFGAIGVATVDAQATPPCDPTQGQLCPDHLKCYQVLKDGHKPAKHVVDLFNQQFGDEKDCKLQDVASLFCAPTQKVQVDGHPPQSPFPTQALVDDYICYKVACKKQKHEIAAGDQFARRDMVLGNAQLLCAPARKLIQNPTQN